MGSSESTDNTASSDESSSDDTNSTYQPAPKVNKQQGKKCATKWKEINGEWKKVDSKCDNTQSPTNNGECQKSDSKWEKVDTKQKSINKKWIWSWKDNDGSYKPYTITVSNELYKLDIGEVYTTSFSNIKYEITKILTGQCEQKNTKTQFTRNVIPQSLPNDNTESHWYWQDNDKSYKLYHYKHSDQLDQLKIGGVYVTYIRGTKYEIKKTSQNACKQKNTKTDCDRNVIRKGNKNDIEGEHKTNDHINQNKVSSTSHWYWQDDDKSYKLYHYKHSDKLDQLKIGGVYVTFIRGTKYEIKKTSQNACKQKNTKTDFERNVIRKAKVNDNKVEQKNDCINHNKVNELFFASVSKSKYKIIEIQDLTKCDNANIYEKVVHEKCKYGRNREAVERYLWHGTKNLDNLKLICKNGFDRSYNTTSVYGKGTYFARDAKYSVNGYCGKDSKGVYCILLCKVIVGEYTIGNSSIKTIPRKADGSEYETLVNNTKDPSIFVVWRDYHAVPCYLVKYK